MSDPKKNLRAYGLTLAIVAVAASLSAYVSASSFTPAAPSLGRATGFVVLGGSRVTCSNGTITGDVGTFSATPTGSVTLTSCPVSGTVHVGDGAAKQAFNNFLTAYGARAPKTGDVCTTLTGTLAGVTLAPGAYCFDAAAALTGVLTLNGPSNGTWRFKIGTLGTGALTGSNFSVVMSGGGQSCNATWWVAQGATMTTSAFQGNILAGAAITLTGGTFTGHAWAKADVSITGTAVSGCLGGGGKGHGDGDHNKGKDHNNQDKHHEKDKQENQGEHRDSS
jgi:hypothetical protein